MPRSPPVAVAATVRLRKFQEMHAADSLDEASSRQLAFDLEQAYTEFHAQLSKK